MGEVWYFAPCGRKMKTIPDVMRVSKKYRITELNFRYFTTIMKQALTTYTFSLELLFVRSACRRNLEYPEETHLSDGLQLYEVKC